ncbi:MAG: hypothetical protein DCE90_18035 [Pseudanabaena sp.]|nr:MAG: hypothetical protein DCE90_18035 [Pseudanabaena sp.]
MKHSELNTGEALHFAKLRTFTGLPSQIRPDFVNQLLARADTRQLYLAIGSGLGQIVEIVAVSPTEGQPATINTQELFAKILIANGEVLTTDQTIIYQD